MNIFSRLFQKPPTLPGFTIKTAKEDSALAALPVQYQQSQRGQIIIKHTNGAKEYLRYSQLAWLSTSPHITETRRRIYTAALEFAHAHAAEIE